MQRPGQILAQLLDRFSPALQPMQSWELVNILQSIGCVTLVKVKNGSNCSLFGESDEVSCEEPTILDEPEDLVVECQVDAVIKMGQFIGDKMYTSDFVCQCPCHPDRD